MSIKTLAVSDITRPCLEIEVIKQNSGAFLPGDSYWSAVDFVLSGKDKKEIVGKYDCLRIQWSQNPSEIWEFLDAVVMLYPMPSENPSRYVLTYEKVQRLCGLSIKE